MVVGVEVGTCDGAVVGEVGLKVGTTLGLEEGGFDGAREGIDVGEVGAMLGGAVGASDGVVFLMSFFALNGVSA